MLWCLPACYYLLKHPLNFILSGIWMDRVGDVVDVLQDLRHGHGEPPPHVQRRLDVGRPQGAQDVQGRAAGGEGLRRRQVRLARPLQDQGRGLHGAVRAQSALRNPNFGICEEPAVSRYTGYLSQLRFKLRDWAVGPERAGCYPWGSIVLN